LPLRFPDNHLLPDLATAISHAFGLTVLLLEKPLSLKEGYDPVRNQYNSTWILAQILKLFPEENCKILGITGLDLYVPVLTFVFGEAQLDGKAAVVSSFRLRDELYGLPKSAEKLKERLEKEAIHELGHTFGLIHCHDPNCVMFTSTYAEEIDFKFKDFCPVCSEFLRKLFLI